VSSQKGQESERSERRPFCTAGRNDCRPKGEVQDGPNEFLLRTMKYETLFVEQFLRQVISEEGRCNYLK